MYSAKIARKTTKSTRMVSFRISIDSICHAWSVNQSKWCQNFRSLRGKPQDVYKGQCGRECKLSCLLLTTQSAAARDRAWNCSRWKICRATLMLVMMVLRPSSKKTTSAAVRAASEAPSTAIPQSAFFNEGASSVQSGQCRQSKWGWKHLHATLTDAL